MTDPGTVTFAPWQKMLDEAADAGFAGRETGGALRRHDGPQDRKTLLRRTGGIARGGAITIEQERDPRNTGSNPDDLAARRSFLRETGF
ncbi:MAG: hypothetical protein KDA73_19605 [Rhodobacteraceae bacterium]|nr:hypothetical protein [Paracoccaceae bacterium]